MPGIPASRSSVAFGLFLLVMLAVAALQPSVQTPLVDIAGAAVTTKEITMVAATLLALFLHVVHNAGCHMPGMAARAVAAALLYTVYALVSIVWTDADPAWLGSQCLMTVLVACSVYLSYAYVRMNGVEHLKRSIAWSMLLFTVICVVYTAESLFNLGLRSADGALVDPMVGIVRVKGPLFAASTGYLLIIPSIAYFSDTSICTLRVAVRYCCIFLLIVTLVTTASRGGIVFLGVFCLLFIRHSLSRNSKLISALVLFVLIALGIGYASTQVSTDRFHTLEDGRETLFQTAVDIMNDRGLGTVVAGTGTASIWPYGYVDMQIRRGNLTASVTTRAGELSVANGNYHPHSVPLYLLGEFGLAGLLLFVGYAVFVITLYKRAAAAGYAHIFCCGLAISLPACFLDLFFFYNHHLGLWWWFWAFSALTITGQHTFASNRPRR
jgi:hypothetical protein